MNPEEEKEREEISRLILRAKTLDEVREARKKLIQWLKRHPDDRQLLGEGESLRMLESAILEIRKRNNRRSFP